MGVYQNFCYKVEDVFVKILYKKQNQELIKEKVVSYRTEKEKSKQQKVASK